MTRYEPRIPPVLAWLILGALIVAGSAVVLAVASYPAHGQECRFSFECPFVASAASKAAPANRYRFRVVRRVARHHVVGVTNMIGDTLTDGDREASPEMPLIWPVMEPEAVSTVEEITHKPSNTSAFLPVPKPKEITPWQHTDQGKHAIVAVILLLVVATVITGAKPLNGATV